MISTNSSIFSSPQFDAILQLIGIFIGLALKLLQIKRIFNWDFKPFYLRNSNSFEYNFIIVSHDYLTTYVMIMWKLERYH